VDRPSKLVYSTQLNRRRFLKYSVSLAAPCAIPHIIHASTEFSSERTLEFVNLHTDETLQCCYWANGEYDPTSLSEINYILRDHRANEVSEIDSNLLDMLNILHGIVGSKAPFHIISGYRSPQTNKKLRQQSRGVAKKSLHMQGKAIDIRLPDIELEDLRDAALSLQAGGVGFYPKSDFIHVDVGKPRSW
jgi:uncharacterized protein YcbK (DUF882 family)